MNAFHRIAGLAAVAGAVFVASDAQATIGPVGTITEIDASSYYFNFTNNEGGRSVQYSSGVAPCTEKGVAKLNSIGETLVVEAFKNGWHVQVEYSQIPGTKCVLDVSVTK